VNGYMKYVALVPVKSLVLAKSRLAPYMPLEQREMLVLDMLEHVLHVLHSCSTLEQVAVVSADARVLQCAREWGAIPMREERAGHNPALHAAAQRLRAEGASALLTLSADLPLLTTRDVEDMIELSWRYDVVLTPSREGTGTSALLVRPPLALPYRFGPNSRDRHLRAAAHRGLSATVFESDNMAFDIDTIEDVQELEQTCREWREMPTYAV
jgi:2-phospho-L-lactate guanylyltransferase